MTNEPLLLIDTNYMCHRAYHVMKDLSHGDRGTGAIYGVLRDIVILQDSFKTRRCVFAFDLGRSKRLGLMAGYKSSRRARRDEAPEEEQIARAGFNRQVEELRRWHLPAAGFKNVFAVKGFEADDIIARIAKDLPDDDEAVIVSSDHDLWQCLRPNVWMWNPQTQKPYTDEMFRKEWGLEPDMWSRVKAYAGCPTDDVPGVPGVGEVTAAKFIRGELGGHTKAFNEIMHATYPLTVNIKVVKLPIHGTPTFKIQPDAVTEEKWQNLAESLRMATLRTAVPRVATRKSKGRKHGKKGFGLI